MSLAVSVETRAKLALLRRMLRRRMLLRGLALVVLAAGVGGLVSFAIDRAMDLTLSQRLLIDLLCVAPVALAFWTHLWRPLRLPMNEQELALVLERRFAHLQQRLISALQLSAIRPEDAGMSSQLVRHVVGQANKQVKDIDVSQAVQGRPAFRAGLLALAAIVLVSGLGLLRPELLGIYLRRHLLWQDVAWPKRTHLRVVGGPSFRVVRGGSVAVGVEAMGQRPAHVSFEMKFPRLGEVWEDVELSSSNHGRYDKTFENVTEGFDFRVSGSDDRTGWQRVSVIDPPELTDVAIRKSYPAYTNRATVDVDLRPGLISAPAGGALEITGFATKPIASATVKLDGKPAGAMEVITTTSQPTSRPTQIKGVLSLPARPEKNAALLEVELAESDEIVNPRALATALQIEPDRPPTLAMEKHGVSHQVTPQATLPLSIAYRDDYGVKAVWIELGRQTTTSATSSSAPSPPLAASQPSRMDVPITPSADGQVQAMLDLQGLSLSPGQSLRVQAAGADTLPAELAGPNVARSGELVFQIVSADDLLAELARRQKELRQEFAQAVELHTLAVARLKGGAEKIRATSDVTELPTLATQTQRDQRSVAAQCVLSARQFQQVLDEMTYNRVITPAEQVRLSQRIIQPLAAVADKPMAQALARVETAGKQDRADAAGKALAQARADMDRIQQQLEAVLAEMRQLESRQELARALRKIIQDSETLQQELKKTATKESPFDPK